MKLNCVFILFFLLPVFAWSQQSITIEGYVTDAKTEDTLKGANVLEKSSQKGTVSDDNGFYRLTIDQCDSAKLKISHMGYITKKIDINCQEGKKLNIALNPGIPLEQVTISEKKKDIVQRNETGTMQIPVKDVKTLPNLLGESDILGTYRHTPGVQSGGGGKNHLYVRGGSSDQNLVLLDDVPLYNVSHFGGYFSVFNTNAIDNTKLIKGGFPARYGGRLSSVLDVKMREGNKKEFSVRGTAGVLAMNVSVEAPIVKDTSSFIFSARKRFFPLFKMGGTGLAYNFYDLNAKANYKFSKKDKLILSFYLGNDILTDQNSSGLFKTSNYKVNWGNRLISLQWEHTFNRKVTGEFKIANTSYQYSQALNKQIGLISGKEIDNTLKNQINDILLKMDFDYQYNSNCTFLFGLHAKNHVFRPNNEKYEQSGKGIENFERSFTAKENALENSVYLDNELELSDNFDANIGLRFSSYMVNQTSYFLPEPRLLANYMFNKSFSAKYSYSVMNQFVHLLSYSGTGFPSDYWLPSTENVEPQNARQHSVQLAKTFAGSEYELSLKAYHKTMQNMITYKPGKSLLGNMDNWENIAETDGTGKNYGVELFFQKKRGTTTGWIGMTLAKALRRFENINNGESYPFKYDRLFDASIVIQQELNDNTVLSATWNYGTGYPITIAKQYYELKGNDIFIYGEKNGFRMKDFHRLDIAANFSKNTDWGKRTWTISVANVYNRMNPYYYYYHKKDIVGSTPFNGNNPVSGGYELYQRTVVGIFPSISYSFEF